MNITIKKRTKNNSERKEQIIGTNFDFGAGYGTDFWWHFHFNGKDKNGLSTTIDVQLNEKEREEFLNKLSQYVDKWKAHINSKKDEN